MSKHLPPCLKSICVYFEANVSKSNVDIYQEFKKMTLDMILAATDRFHKDVVPIHRLFEHRPSLKVHFTIYNKSTITITVIFSKSYSKELSRSPRFPPTDVTGDILWEMLNRLDKKYGLNYIEKGDT